MIKVTMFLLLMYLKIRYNPEKIQPHHGSKRIIFTTKL
jgi:hypothetical protein